MNKKLVFVAYEVDEYGYHVYCFDEDCTILYTNEGNNLDSMQVDERYNPKHPEAMSKSLIEMDALSMAHFIRDKYYTAEVYDVVYIGGIKCLNTAYTFIHNLDKDNYKGFVYNGPKT